MIGTGETQSGARGKGQPRFLCGKKVVGAAEEGPRELRATRLEVDSAVWLWVLPCSSGSEEKKTGFEIQGERSCLGVLSLLPGNFINLLRTNYFSLLLKTRPVPFLFLFYLFIQLDV